MSLFDVTWDTLQEVKKCKPSALRVKFDLDVCRALGVSVTEDDLRKVYCAVSDDLIISRGLKRE